MKKLRVPIQNSVIVCEYSWGFVLTKFRCIKLTVTLVTTSNGFKFYPWHAEHFHSWWNFLDISVIVRLNLQSNFRTHYFLDYTIPKHSFPARSLKISSLICDFMRQNFGLCLSFRIQWRALQFRAQCFEENTMIFLCVNLQLSNLISCRKNSKA